MWFQQVMTANVSSVGAAVCSILVQEPVDYVEDDVMTVDPDELSDEIAEHSEHLEALIQRSTEQAKDIKKLKKELKKLEEDINSPDGDEDSASGVAQS